MISGMSISDFINSPDTVDFIARKSEYLDQFITQNPDILTTQILAGKYVIGYVHHENIDKVMERLGSSSISSMPFVLGLLDRANLEAAGIIQVQEQPYLGLLGQGVLIGIIDTGIDYTQEVFKYEDGTSKIRYIYDQTASGPPPENFFIGTEYTNEQINEALKAEDPYTIVPQRDTSGHGTFLASIAAGREVGNYIGAAPESELLVVKLKDARPYYRQKYLVPADQKYAFESSAVMIGIEYLLLKAQQLKKPIAICIAIGTNQGTHDGFSIMGEYLSTSSNNTNVAIFTAAGNESQSRRHMQGTLVSTGEKQNIDIKVGDNAGDIYVSITSGVSDRISVGVTSPTGEIVGRVPARSGSVYSTKLVLERSTIVIEYYFPVEGSAGQMTIVKIINATPGIWSIVVNGDIVLDGTYHAWLPITGFVSPTVEFLTPNPYYTIVVPGTSIGTITVGAYNNENNSLYPNSSWGPTRLPMISPDFAAPGVDVGGYYPTGYGTMSGTSVATAIATGAGALLLQWGVVEGNDVAMGTYQIRGYLIRGCSRDENIVYPNTQWGFGRLNLIQTFNRMRELQ